MKCDTVMARAVATGALVALSSAACAYVPTRAGRGVMEGLNDKPVSTKEAPTSLVAADGTRCLVSEAKFRETAAGERVWCFWSAGTGDGVAARTAGPNAVTRPTATSPLKGKVISGKPAKSRH